MKKTLMMTMTVTLLMSSCGTYTGQGAYAGGSFGSVLGSAIGGLSGGWRGHHIGTIVGMAGGAAIGAAIGQAADQKREEEYQQRRRDYEAWQRQKRGDMQKDGAYQQQGGADDRIDFDGRGPSKDQVDFNSNGTIKNDAYKKKVLDVVIRNERFMDASRDAVLSAGEECIVTFEIMNRSDQTIYDVQPLVMDVTGNKHIHISPNLHVESIAPHSGIRYTASILAGKKLKNGEIVISLGVSVGGQEIASQTREYTVETKRK